jgi:hypothetical protein
VLFGFILVTGTKLRFCTLYAYKTQNVFQQGWPLLIFTSKVNLSCCILVTATQVKQKHLFHQGEALTYGFSNRYPRCINPLTPELNFSAQRCLTRFFTGDFAS